MNITFNSLFSSVIQTNYMQFGEECFTMNIWELRNICLWKCIILFPDKPNL